MSVAGAPLRVLVTVDAVGGVWQYATDLARELGQLGIETLLALLGPAPSSAQRAAAFAIPRTTLIDTDLLLDWMADDAGQIAAAGSRIAELAREHRVDLIQLNQPALAAGISFPVPLIAVSHSCLATWWAAVEGGEPPADFAWRAALHGEGLRAAERIVCPSDAFAEATRVAYRLRERPLGIHNGRNLAVPDAPIEDFAFTAGRLWDRGKDAATLDRAAARLACPVRAAGSLTGPNGERISLDHLQTSGQLDEAGLARCLAARPVFVSTARYEPFGLSVLEAASAGCGLVLADIPTFRELWSDAATFVAPGDDRAFAEVIGRLISDRPLRLAEGAKARTAARRFTPGRTGAAMATLYAGLLPRRAADRAAA